MRKRRRAFCSAPILLAAACCMTALCSMSSPLYPINIWDDANCLLTVGRAMRAGKVLYRDIYEQKGPLLYFAHWMAACVSGSSFFGVYLLESLCVFGFLAAAARLLRRRIGSAALPAAILAAACVLSGGAFVRGDSAEEFCLPFTMAALCLFDGGLRDRAPLSPRRLFVIGILAGLVATVKFTLLGAFLGLCLAEGIAALRSGGPGRGAKSAAVFLAGMALPVLPWALYFAGRNALPDFFTAYVYNNIALYAGEVRMGTREWAAFARGNWWWALPCLAGLALFAGNRKEPPLLRAGTLLAFLIQLLAVLLPGRVWQYSLLCLAPFAVYGAVPAARFAEAAARRVQGSRARGRGIPPAGEWAAASLLSLALCVFATPNAFLRGVPLSGTVQGRLAGKIPAGSSFLQYKFLDDGLYLASGAIPQEKFFVLLNVQLPEMREELDRYVSEGIPEYVLSTYDPLPERFERYALVATDVGYLDDNRPRKDFFLYRRKGPAEAGD